MTVRNRLRGRLASAFPGNLAVRLDRGALCSFTFDDCPTCSLRTAGGLLESVGAAGTFFVSARMAMNDTAVPRGLIWGDDLIRAFAAGHEIGCHTFSHVSLRALGRSEIERELDENRRAIQSVLPDVQLTSFSYPFGEVSFTAKSIVSKHFGVARGIRPGLNGRVVDLAELRTYGIWIADFAEARLARVIQAAARRGAWLVFMTHDVAERPGEWGCTTGQFEFVLRAVCDAGIPILPLRAAVGRVAFRSARR